MKYIPTLCRVLFFCILCGAALAFTSGLMAYVKCQWPQVYVVFIATIISLILSKFFARWERIKMIDVGITPNRKSFSKFLTGLGIGLLLAASQPILVLMAGHVKLIPAPAVSYPTILISFILYLAIGLREEISFRGFPLFGLQRVAGPWLALLITGIIFIVEHKIGGMNWRSAIFGAGVGSILFGLAAIKTKGLAFPTGLHTTWNFGQWLFGFKKEPGVLKIVIEKGQEGRIEMMGWISYLLVMSIAISILYYYRKNHINNFEGDR